MKKLICLAIVMVFMVLPVLSLTQDDIDDYELSNDLAVIELGLIEIYLDMDKKQGQEKFKWREKALWIVRHRLLQIDMFYSELYDCKERK